MRNRLWDRGPRTADLPFEPPRRPRHGGLQMEVRSGPRWGRSFFDAHGMPGDAGSAPRAIPLHPTDAKRDCPAWRQETPPGRRLRDDRKNDRRALPWRAPRHTASILYSPVVFALRTLTLR